MAEIAQRAHVAEGTLYLYFRNKEALLLAVVGAFYERLTESADEGVSRSRTARRQLEFLARHHMTSCLDGWRILELLTTYHIAEYRGSAFQEFNKNYVAIFDEVLRAGMGRGEVRRDVALSAVRDLFYGGLDYACRTHLVHGGRAEDHAEIAKRAKRIVELVWRAVEASAPPSADGTPGPADLAEITERLEAVAGVLENVAGARDDE